MASREAKMLKELGRLGYEFDRKNSKGIEFWVHPDRGCEVRFPSGKCDDGRLKDVLADAFKQLGIPTKDNKRNPAQIRERNAAEHARAARELEQARASLTSARTARDEPALRAAEEAYLNAERQFRYWDRLMRQAAS